MRAKREKGTDPRSISTHTFVIDERVIPAPCVRLASKKFAAVVPFAKCLESARATHLSR